MIPNVAQKRPYASILAEENQKQEVIEQEEEKTLNVSKRITTQEKNLCTDIVKKLIKHPCGASFLHPVDPIYFNIPDYFDVIKNPIDLGTIRKKISSYKSKEQFISDIELMLDNCYTYNNQTDPVCEQARELEKFFEKQVVKLRAMNPSQKKVTAKQTTKKTSPLSDNELKICQSIVKEFKKPKYVQFTWVFERPVDASAWGASDYYDIIKQPMDMLTIEKKLRNSEYTNETQLYDDYKLMFQNCYKYNPPQHDIHLLGKKFEEAFEKHWSNLHDKDKESKSKKQRISIDNSINPTTSKNTPKNTVTIQRTINGSHKTIPTPAQSFSVPSVVPITSVTQAEVDSVNPKTLGNLVAVDPIATTDPVTTVDPVTAVDPVTTVYPVAVEDPVAVDSIASAADLVKMPINNIVQSSLPGLVRTSVSAPALSTSALAKPSVPNPKSDSKTIKKSASNPNSTPKYVHTAEPSSQSNDGRNVLRIKLQVTKTENEIPKTSQKKPAAKAPVLALTKEPPVTAPTKVVLDQRTSFTPTPKLAVDHRPPSPQQDKKDSKTPTTLKNHDKWLTQAKQHAIQQQQSPNQSVKIKTSLNNHTIHKSTSGPIGKSNFIPSTTHRRLSNPKIPEPSKTPMFDIGDLFNKINDEKRLRQQQLRDEQERSEREERIRKDKEKQRYEEIMVKKREFRQKMLKKKELDKKHRENALSERVVDISSQKMSSHIFESTILSKDLDWRDLNNWQRETVDYRHIPVPAFVRRSNVNLQELRSKLLNKSVRLKNFKKQTDRPNQTASHDSDMDIE